MPAIKRSYHRNLGYARFWMGASLTILALLFAFVMDRVNRIVSELAGDRSEVGFSEVTGIFALIFAAASCAGLAIAFWHLYRRDDFALSSIEHGTQEATP